MIQHLNAQGVKPKRVVILGGSGFLGRYLIKQLDSLKIPSLSISSKDADLTNKTSIEFMKKTIQPTDAVVFASCLTPDRGRDIGTTMKNLAMGENVCLALQESPCDYLVYISTDAVYADGETLIREDSRCEASSLYGLGHFMRERMIHNTCKEKGISYFIARPTLLYGPGDPHGSYGPNRFLKQINDNGQMKIFGNGEEQRDHVYIGDVARLLGECLQNKTVGILNIAKGKSTSFLKVAELCQQYCPTKVTIERLPRSGGTISHTHFDISNLIRAFPMFKFTTLNEGIPLYFNQSQKVAA